MSRRIASGAMIFVADEAPESLGSFSPGGLSPNLGPRGSLAQRENHFRFLKIIFGSISIYFRSFSDSFPVPLSPRDHGKGRSYEPGPMESTRRGIAVSKYQARQIPAVFATACRHHRYTSCSDEG